jgi:hypothetical protein
MNEKLAREILDNLNSAHEHAADEDGKGLSAEGEVPDA